jgi:hypothetical protein
MVNLLSNDIDRFIDANFTPISDVKRRHIFHNCQVTVKWLRKYFTQLNNGHVLKHAYNEVNNLLMIISIRTLF